MSSGRARTFGVKELRRQAKLEARSGVVDLELVQLQRELEAARPRTRADCARIPRPCPFALCRHHLALEVSHAGGLKENFPGVEFYELEETCSLDVAERGGLTLEAVGRLVNVTRERLRQMETAALLKLRTGIEEGTGCGPNHRSSRPLTLKSRGGVAP